tara:strand:+ start:8772 stop:9761 length:990 start_codon:yes stop_codon:yes gene_type:complete
MTIWHHGLVTRHGTTGGWLAHQAVDAFAISRIIQRAFQYHWHALYDTVPAITAGPAEQDTLMTTGIILPEFDPFLINFGGFGVRWYALAYIVGLLAGYWILRREARRHTAPIDLAGIDSLLNHVLLGVILGGRIGFVLFYQPSYYLANPLDILKVWQGGMAFHGGLSGVIIAMWLFARRRGIPFLSVSDRVAMVVPIGLCLGRISNFINAELYGRVTDMPWGMVFPGSDGMPRHPSQLYEAGLEGLLIGLVMLYGYARGWLDMTGRLSAVLLIGYGLARFMVEFVREPDPQLGTLMGLVTMGQLLCLPMIAGGLYILWRSAPGNGGRTA